MCIIKYNKGYDLYIVYDGENLPKFIYKGKELKPYLKRSNSGLQYPIINIPDRGENYCHRLVLFAFGNKEKYWEAYIRNDNRKPLVHHINGNTFDYRPENLMYLSISENTKIHNAHMTKI